MASIPLISRLCVEGVNVKNSKTISDAASLLSSNPFCIRHTYAAASILQEAINTGEKLTLEKIISLIPKDNDIDEQILEELKNVTIALNNNQHYSDAVELWGKQCANPGSFMGSVYSIVTSNNYCDGIRKTIKAGGCNCSRANFIGCVLGAIYGFNEENGISKDWLQNTDKSTEILELAINLICK
jgi:ADP-ribosylglycohydrolase